MPVASQRPASSVVISASIAYDHLMSFGGSFADHIIPEKTHVISLSFLVDTLRKQRGGVGGNVAYNLALLGQPSTLVGAVGSDFGPYRRQMEELGVDLTHVLEFEQELTASAFMMADLKSNQIASFYPGPSERAEQIPVRPLGDAAEYALLGATGPATMRRHTLDLGESNARLIYDPAFQVILLSDADIRAGIERAYCVIGNDYEFAMIEQKTSLTVDAIADMCELVVMTLGEHGSELRSGGDVVKTPPAQVDVVVDPTGAGDAYRAGLIKGLLLGQGLEVVGRIAGLTAAYAVEQVGTQEHSHNPHQFVTRFDQSFRDFAGAITERHLSRADVVSSR